MNHGAASNSNHVLSRVVWALAFALLAPTAGARTVFFDGFEGPDFHPRWSTVGPSGGVWTYDFADSMFNLRSVTAQAPGQIPWRDVGISTPLDLPGDFTVSARVGWEAGGPARRIGIQVLGAGLLYMDEWLTRTPRYYWSFSGGVQGSIPAPVGGFATLTISRSGQTARALINGVEVARTNLTAPVITGVIIDILGDSRQMQPLHIDSVDVVPSPSTAVLLAWAVLASLARHRRR
jgi:hypothetical protein